MRGIFHHEDFGWSNAPRFGGGTSVPSTTTQTTNSSPWIGQQGYLDQVFGSAANLYNNPGDYPQYYPGQTYAALTAPQNTLIGSTENYGYGGGDGALQGANSALSGFLSPSYTGQTSSAFGYANPEIGNLSSGSLLSGTQPAFSASNNYLTSTLNGANLNPFSAPGFQNVVNGTLASVLPATSASFINGGRADGGLAQAAQTAAATNAIGSLANSNYLSEQGLQSQAAGLAGSNQAIAEGNTLNAGNLASNNLLTQQGNQIKSAAVAPSVDQSQLSDLTTALSAAGLTQQDQQNLINSSMARYNYNEALPFNMLGQYQNYVGGSGYGGTTTGQSTTPYYENTGANYLAAGTGVLGLGLTPLGIGGSTGVGGSALGALAGLMFA